ncbi:MAG: hypothetical protein WCK67_08070 [bacterium]
MGIIIKYKKWRKYQDYRINQYCISECPKCIVDKSNGSAFCWGKFSKDSKTYLGRGIECEKIINFCFSDDVKQI